MRKVLTAAAAAALAAAVIFSAASLKTDAGGIAGHDSFVVDQAGVLEQKSVQHLDQYLAALLRDADIDLRVLSLPALGDLTVEAAASGVFEDWKIGGRSKANRGVLFLLAVKEQKVRLAVSYGLEAVFPDAFISYIEHEQMLPYFNQGALRIGFAATIEMIAGRGFQKIRQQEYDPSRGGDRTIMGYRQGGAGGQTDVRIGSAPQGGNEMNLPQDVRAYFAAQPSAELAWQRFLELNLRRISDPNLGLYTESSKQMLRVRPYTKAAMDMIVRDYRGQRYEIREKGDRAAVLFPEDPERLRAPWFFVKSPEGWQFDGRTFSDVVGFNHKNQWHFRRSDHPYAFAFADYSFDAHGFAFRRKPAASNGSGPSGGR